MRRVLAVLAALALAAVLIVGLSQAGGEADRASAPEFDLAHAKRRLQGAPAPLAALHEQSAALLEGGTDAFRKRLRELRGIPVVINKWASWCRPCRAEFPVFQQLATDRGKELAFLGLNSGDKRPAAERFLAEQPVPYPSYEDPGEAIARSLKAAKYFPVTVFVDERGRTAFVHMGEYTSRAELEADVDRYLGST